MNQQLNARVLVIDDEEAVRDSFREILVPSKHDTTELEQASSNLFEEKAIIAGTQPEVFEFDLDVAAGGKEGLAQVQRAVSGNRPFAAIFVDMRMPGWDGLKTVEHIRKIDQRAEIIFVTAYSDYGIDEVVRRAGTNVSYHCKPFSVEEVRQIATKAVFEWNKTRSLENLIEIIGQLRTQRWQLEQLLDHILHEVARLIGVRSAMLAARDDKSRYRKVVGIGVLADDGIAREYLDSLAGLVDGRFCQTDRFAYFQVEQYGVIALFDTSGKLLNNERVYIVRLFLEQAGQAIANVALEEALLRKEKLSAIGQAASMIAHDLRGHIGAIWSGIEMVEAYPDNRELAVQMHHLAMKAGEDALIMVDDILDFATSSQVVKSDVNLPALLDSVRDKAVLFLERLNVPLKIERVEALDFKGDQRKMDRVLLNLIRNSAEALHKHTVQQPVITVCAQASDGGLQIRVSDNGPGIPEEMHSFLFDAFSSYGKTTGTGLGLAIVKQFVEGHGGTVSFETSSQGTTFNVEIPAE